MHPKKVPLNILLADDDDDDRFFFAKALKQLPLAHLLKTVVDGERLLKYLSENQKKLPDILFLDFNMPRKNGGECLKEIKLNPLWKKIPVIIHTTYLRDEVATSLYEAGAHYYLQKCEFSKLAEFIQLILNLLNENPHQPSRENFIIGSFGDINSKSN